MGKECYMSLNLGRSYWRKVTVGQTTETCKQESLGDQTSREPAVLMIPP